MRIVALGTVGLAALVSCPGCNWVFGLDPVRLTDGRVDDVPPDANLPTVRLSAITPMLVNGGVTGQATYVPITPAPRVQYGRRGEALVDTTYNGVDVPVGYAFAEATETWRLVYTLDGGVPHEVHWKPSVMARPGHAVVLQLAPNERALPPPAPAMGSFSLSPTNPPATWSLPRVYTTNTWTLDPSPPVDMGYPVSNFRGPQTVAMAGAKRVPDPLLDFEVLLDYDDSAANNTCTVAKGSASFAIDLATGTSSDGSPPTWAIGPKTGDYTITTPSALGLLANLTGANGLASISDVAKVQLVTYGPGGSIPIHHWREDGIALPVPVGILLARCLNLPPGNVDRVPAFNYPARVTLPTIGTLMYVTRSIPLANGALSIQNGVEVSAVGTIGPFNLATENAAFAGAPTVDGVSVNVKDITTEVAIPAGGATAALDFELVGGGSTPLADFYEATLYRVDGATMTPVREYTFTEKPLVFDRDQGLPATTKYVFAIRVIRGASVNVANGDFSVWGNTQTLGLTHTQIFTLAP